MKNFVKNILEFYRLSIKLINLVINDYKQCKIENKNHIAKTKISVSESLNRSKKEYEEWEIERKKLLNENILYNKKTGMYCFKITVKHNNISKTFSCEEKTEKLCKAIAPFVLNRAFSYKLFGSKE